MNQEAPHQDSGSLDDDLHQMDKQELWEEGTQLQEEYERLLANGDTRGAARAMGRKEKADALLEEMDDE